MAQRKKDYRVIVVGVGMVGSMMVRVLRERKFPAKEIKILATRERIEEIAGRKYQVKVADAQEFDGFDLAFFAGTEGASGASKLYGWEAVSRGVVVIDNGKDFRMDPRVPLVVPEVNAEALKRHQGFIANPNCSTTQMVVALAPIHRAARIKRIVVSTYQAVSGTGSKARVELEQQVRDWAAGKKPVWEQYVAPIAFNLMPQIAGLKHEFPGYYEEEIKMVKETRKILGDPRLQVSATCVRVPVLNGHSEAINVQTAKKLSVAQARRLLAKAPGVVLVDQPDLDQKKLKFLDPRRSRWPYPQMADGRDEVFVGRIREDLSAKNALDLFCVSDNIRKGAATNAVQIAEELVKRNLL
ncbi:MAG: aspartate-semialdehyde dehydrogenase [Deltaproteobacteria bacterium RBG_13_61_14]|nr:MAG: aspartate-semialdehyde dehydrogenase [Deltaproteobacteria bacterium RBG_13_61_14]